MTALTKAGAFGGGAAIVAALALGIPLLALAGFAVLGVAVIVAMRSAQPVGDGVATTVRTGSVSIRGDGNTVNTSVTQHITNIRIGADSYRGAWVTTFTQAAEGQGGPAATIIGHYPHLAGWERAYAADIAGWQQSGTNVMGRRKVMNGKRARAGLIPNTFYTDAYNASKRLK